MEKIIQYAISTLRPDVFCLQEIRTGAKASEFAIPGYRGFFNPAEESRFYGTAVYLRDDVAQVEVAIPHL